MQKKLLLLLLISISFVELNAQTNFLVITSTCDPANSYEMVADGTINGKESFIGTNSAQTQAWWDATADAPPTTATSVINTTTADTVGIQWDGSQWIFYANSDPSLIAFTNAEDTPAVPINGWVITPTFISFWTCGANYSSLDIYDGNVSGFVEPKQHIVINSDANCGPITIELETTNSQNYLDAFKVIEPTSWGAALGATSPGANAFEIKYSPDQFWWELSAGATLFYIVPLPTPTSIKAPATGWLPVGFCDSTGAVLSILGSSTTLPVDNFDFNEVSIYPNPSTNYINISNLKESNEVRFTNIMGQMVKKSTVDANNNRIDIQDLSNGFYFVEIAGKKTIKLIKK